MQLPVHAPGPDACAAADVPDSAHLNAVGGASSTNLKSTISYDNQ